MFSFKSIAQNPVQIDPKVKKITTFAKQKTDAEQVAQDAHKERLRIGQQEKEDACQRNQRLYDSTMAETKKTVQGALTWTACQKNQIKQETDERNATLSYNEKKLAIETKYGQKEQASKRILNTDLLKIERDFHRKLLAEHEVYQSLQRRRAIKLQAAKEVYGHTAFAAKGLFKASKQSVLQPYNQKAGRLHAEAVQAHNDAHGEYSRLFKTLYIDSHCIMAGMIGLKGVTEDIDQYVSIDSVYNAVQPLISNEDFCAKLCMDYQKKEKSPFIADFYTIASEDAPPNIAALQEAIRTLDLSPGAKFFTHRCLFEKPNDKLDKNTLYVDIQNHALQCTVLSPDGDVLSYEYLHTDELAGQCVLTYRQRGTLQAFISEHTLDILRDMYKHANLFGFDAFSYLMGSVSGFKEHVYRTMAKYNQALALSHGWESMPLTKLHLYRSSTHKGSALDQTPLGRAQKQVQEKIADLSAAYPAAARVLIDERDASIASAQRVYDNALESAQCLYNATQDAVDSEMEFDLINAEIMAYAEAFRYCDIAPLSTIEQSNRPVQPVATRANPSFFKSTINALNREIYTIQEENEDAELNIEIQ